jgi:hypothetical protein
MLTLLAHLWGDYVLQSHTMAVFKTWSWRWAFLHATVYTIPYALLTQDVRALAVILVTHAIIDRLAIAQHWCRWWGVGFAGLWWRRKYGVFKEPPAHIKDWLKIIVDNTFHLTINYGALTYFVSGGV